ncbi:hypothetical protein DICVIV_01727 [Dictyocaulus viviparus]|uniref:Uncharacterized protein n=1 Tax=Dictyocaulus viviparus TaxID=29172 RepID=A0A0D8YBS7_DICVI|nr:hypothetical protein DICVIV_01727 [Dictyocaulus viviparus]
MDPSLLLTNAVVCRARRSCRARYGGGEKNILLKKCNRSNVIAVMNQQTIANYVNFVGACSAMVEGAATQRYSEIEVGVRIQTNRISHPFEAIN